MILEGEHSKLCKVLSGVSQGTVMAPLLFLIYINDIPNSITNMLRLYEDDDCINLLTDLSTVQKLCKTWQMEFNPTKCEYLQITNKHNFIDTHYTLYGHNIQKVTNAKYLGITFDCHLNWKSHINIIDAKANAAFYQEILLSV